MFYPRQRQEIMLVHWLNFFLYADIYTYMNIYTSYTRLYIENNFFLRVLYFKPYVKYASN